MLAFDRGDARAAAEAAARYLRRVPLHNRTDRVVALDLLIRALAAAGDVETAKTALAEMNAIATLVATKPLTAAASLAAGYVALAEKRPDESRRHLEDAVDLFVQSGAPFEVARARASSWPGRSEAGRIDAARDEAQRAIDLLARNAGRELEIARARTVTGSPSRPEPMTPPRASGSAAGLTAREIEVLKLVADGLNNQVIAGQAVRERAHRASSRGEYLLEAECVVARRGSRARRRGVICL